MLQLALTVSIYLLIVIPAGVYLYHIAAGKHTFADPVFDRVDGAIYKISGVDPGKGMNWKFIARRNRRPSPCKSNAGRRP